MLTLGLNQQKEGAFCLPCSFALLLLGHCSLPGEQHLSTAGLPHRLPLAPRQLTLCHSIGTGRSFSLDPLLLGWLYLKLPLLSSQLPAPADILSLSLLASADPAWVFCPLLLSLLLLPKDGGSVGPRLGKAQTRPPQTM
jgi:hypothetical protein